MKKLILVLFLLCAVLRLSATTPVPYTEAVDFSFRISGGGTGMMTFYDESPVIPGVSMNYAPLPTTESEIGTAWLRPGKSYVLSFGWSGPWEYTFSLTAPEGYQIYIDDQPTDVIRRYTGGGEGGHYYNIRLMPANLQGLAEFSSFSGIQLGKSVTWSVGLGGLPDTGRSAGRLMFKEKDLATAPASRARLYYAVPANYGSVVALYDDPATQTVLRQLLLPQGGIDLVDDASGGYWMKFYTKENSWYDPVAWPYAQFQGTPWKTVRVQSPAANQLKITETEGAATRVSLLELTSGNVPSGAYVWTLREGDASTWLRTTTHASTSAGAVASGGTVTTSGNYTVHTFSASGTFSLNTALARVEAVIVAGGGGGGQQHAGGGGAGGLLSPSGLSLEVGNYPITVGGGGAGGTSYPYTGINGGNSLAFNYTAIGGGAGTGMDQYGNSGGSGGGDGYPSGGVRGGEGTAGQGNRGSRGPLVSTFNGGGGGGAGGPGNGSIGGLAATTWAGTFAGGGGGGFAGGIGGGAGAGAGGLAGTRGGDAAANSGSGGGGGGNLGAIGGNGGSGIVVVRYPTRRDTIVTVRTGDTTGTIVSKIKYQYGNFAWGEELVAVEADPDGAKLKTSYEYYTDSAARGHYRKVKSTTDAIGNWAAFQYYDDWDRRGNVYREFHPYLDAPATVSFDPASGRVVEYQYEADWTGRFSRLTLRQERTNNVLTAKSTRTNGDIVGQGWPRESATTVSYSDANNAVTQYSEQMRGDAGLVEPGRPYVVRSSDGSQTSWSRELGTYDAATTTFTTLASNWNFRELVIHGSSISTGAESQTGWSGQTFAQIYLIANKSTMDATIYNNRGQLIRAETWVYTGGGNFSRMTAEDLTYDFAGRLLTRVSNGNTAVANTIANGRLTSTVDGSGVETQFTAYDGLGRVVTAVKKGAPSVAATLTTGYNYPAQGDISTTSTYDGASRVLQQVTTGGTLTQTSSRIYDLAGRPTSETAPGGFTTGYAYSPSTRTVTVTLPGGGTKIATTYLDGQPFTITGTAAISEYVTYWVDPDGRKACQRTLGGISSAWTNLCWDWLGRQVEAWHPGWNGNGVGQYWDYNSKGQLWRVRQEGAAATLCTFDTHGQLASQGLDINANGTLDAASDDRITLNGWSFFFDGGGWMLSKIQSIYPQSGSTATVQIGRVDQKLAGMVANRLARTDSYDVNGNVSYSYVDVDRANKKLTSWSQLSSATNKPTSITYNGLLVEAQDQTGVTMRYEYDALGRPIKSIDPRTGTTTTAYKTGSSLVDTVTDPNNVVQAAYAYDAAGRVATVTNGLGKVERYAYSTLGQLTQQWGDTASPTEFGYDSVGRRTTMKTYRAGTGWAGPTATVWPTTTGTADITTWTFHQASGLLKSKLDAGGRQVNYTYTQAGQLATRIWARDNLFTATPTDDKVTTSYTYSSTTGELAGVGYNDGTPATSYTYNRLGQLATVNDATGLRTFNFNLAGTLELQNEQLSAFYSSRRLTYGYDTATGVKGRLNAFGLGYAANGYSEQTVSYGFSAADARLTSITANSAGHTAATSNIGYLANSHLVEQVSQPAVGYTDVRVYDPKHNWVDSRATNYGAIHVAQFGYEQDNMGRITKITKSGDVFARYGAGSPGLATGLGYNDRNELTAESTTLAGSSTPLLGRSDIYGFDNGGNRLSTSHNGSTASYTPDAMNQYTSRTVPGVFDVAGAAAAGASVTVTAGGAPSTASRQGEYFFKDLALTNTAAAVSTTITMSNGATSANLVAYLPAATQSFTYDLDGNLTGDGRWTYSYDAENRMIGVETAPAAIAAGVPKQGFDFTNDYLGRRVQKIAKSWNGSAWTTTKQERFVYRGWELVAVINPSGVVIRSVFWGIDAGGAMGSASGAGGAGGLLMIQEAGQSYLPAYDAMGNLHGLTKASDGSLAAAYEYDAFGNTLRESGTYAASNPFRFATKYADVETGLIYYGLRYYNPALGRFNNRDPLEERGGNNLYAFCHNNAANGWDVLGLSDAVEYSGGPYMPWNSPSMNGSTNMWMNTSASDLNGRLYVDVSVNSGQAVAGAGHDKNGNEEVYIYDKATDTFSAVSARWDFVTPGNAITMNIASYSMGTSPGAQSGSYGGPGGPSGGYSRGGGGSSTGPSTPAVAPLPPAPHSPTATTTAPNKTAEQPNQPAGYKIVIGAHFDNWRDGIGHTYVVLIDPKGNTHSYGFYPKDSINGWSDAIPTHPGAVAKDYDMPYYAEAQAGEKWNVMKTFDITPQQFVAARAQVTAWEGATYHALTNNCTSFAYDVLGAAGVGLPGPTWISTPGDVFEQIGGLEARVTGVSP